MNEQMRRLQAFAESGAIGAYDADDLHSDVRWLLGAYRDVRSALAMVATWEPTPDPDPWQDLSGRASALIGLRRMANIELERIDRTEAPPAGA